MPLVRSLAGAAVPPSAPSANALAAEAIRRLGLQASLPAPAPPTSWWSFDLSYWLLAAAVVSVLVLLFYCCKDMRWRPRGGVGALDDLPPDALAAGQPLHLARADHFAGQGAARSICVHQRASAAKFLLLAYGTTFREIGLVAKIMKSSNRRKKCRAYTGRSLQRNTSP